LFAVVAGVTLLLVNAFAGTRTVVPTTTLAAETGNNTSASDSFTTQPNGNIGQANVSKEPIVSLLYPGATTPIYAHFMPWFGGNNHINVGYNSNDPIQIARQVDDMMSRGIAGVIIDWYGPNFRREDDTTYYMMLEAERRGGQFTFAIMEDVGALNQCAATPGCDVTQQVIDDLTYAYNRYEQSPAYMRIGGRPVVSFFGVEQYAINWNIVRAGVPGNPLLIFRNAGGFTQPQTDGGFSWVEMNRGNPYDIGLGYLDYFYSMGVSHPALLTLGSGYPGFNDSLASWRPNPPRLMHQQCGQVWLSTMTVVGKYFSTSSPLDVMQIVTWNDYEEGTEIESGINSCVGISASVSGSTLNWTISGSVNTIHHFTVFISADGVNLMPLANLPATATSYDLDSAGMAPGSYQVLVKAVGKPSLTNKMSAAATYSPANGAQAAGNVAPAVTLSVSPASGTTPLALSASTAGSRDADGSIASTRIDFGDGSVANTASASHTYSTAGTYTVRATVTDNLGASSTVAATVTANAPVPRAVTISTLMASASVYRPVRVIASASTPYRLNVLQLYVDGVKVYEVASNRMNTAVKMSAGTHRLTVQGLDSAGAFQSTIYVKVLRSSPPRPPSRTRSGPDR
jgi:PKD repeat protein